MRKALLLSLMLMGLTAAAGCGAAQMQEAVDPSSDPEWLPPGQGDLEVADAPVVEEKPRPKPRPRALKKPNTREIDTRPLHAKMGHP